MPSRQIVSNILEKDMIGEPVLLEAEYSAPLTHKQRVCDPALAGGALLDIGIYCLSFASMFFGNDIIDISTTFTKFETGVDATDNIHFTYRDGKKAHLRTSMVNSLYNRGIIQGTHGRLEVDDINNFSSIRVYDAEGNLLYIPEIPQKINGLEYELLACVRALETGTLECEELPHHESIQIMKQMDFLRRKWGIIYPFEIQN
ncbi:hypothetical protein FMM75_09170 [Lachnospiraceae bacterium MD335]|nr:hypothetical protein [Lachnospiraceae bacterium MD335]